MSTHWTCPQIAGANLGGSCPNYKRVSRIAYKKIKMINVLSVNIEEGGEMTFLGRAGVVCRSEAVNVNIKCKCFHVRGRCNIFAVCLLKTVSPLARMEKVPRGSCGLLGKVYFI